MHASLVGRAQITLTKGAVRPDEVGLHEASGRHQPTLNPRQTVDLRDAIQRRWMASRGEARFRVEVVMVLGESKNNGSI